MPEGDDPIEAATPRRSYDSTLRRQRAGETRERIVAAGCDILRGTSIRDWRALTVRAVAEGAGVNERTVYRHFVNERRLRDAVLRQLERDAGVDLVGLRLEDVVGVTTKIFRHVSGYPLGARPPMDPTLAEAGQREREALLAAVAARTAEWSDVDRTVAAAMINVLWAVGSYERVVVDWQLDPDDAIRGITWVVGLIEAAVRDDRRPTDPTGPAHIEP